MAGMFGGFGAPLVSPDAGPIPGVPLEQPKNLFRFGEQTIWSTQLLQNGNAIASGTFRMFTTPLGQVGQGFANALSIGETNLKEGGRVPSGVAYDVFGVAAQVESAVGAGDTQLANPIVAPAIVGDLVNIIQNGVLSWDFTQTQVDIAPVTLAGAGGGAFGAVATADTGTPVTTGHMNNGNGGIWMYRKHPVALPGNSTFAIVLRFGSRAAPVSANNSVAVRVVLLGYYKNIIEIG
jgi:hypothetical protein